jgi:hypothetical protein
MLRVAILGPSQGLLLTSLGRDPRFPRAIRRHFTKPRIQTDRYTCPATLGVTIVPSGSTTTKNFFIGPVIRDCSARSLAMEKSPFPEEVHAPGAMRFLILGLVTTIAVRITDNRIKTILYNFVRLNVQIGCRIDCRLTRCRYSSLSICDERDNGKRTVYVTLLRENRTMGSIEEPPRTEVRGGWMTQEGLESFNRRL